jgi:hypothetical protein
MLMDVKPGMVLSSLTKILFVRVREKIAARHSGSVDGAEGAHGVFLKGDLDLFLGERRGNHEPRSLFQIFRGVIVELAVRHDFARDGRAHVVVAQHRDFDFARRHARARR